ncbi:MAG TPA: GNAT family N-acetyltransferase [Candidatus Kapabacteria bacterium]|jgi:GNAT superfamily N-acetyltransferase|nr:GNAT family N-acetyltransferase [Candidatus Kapabacteria bacterium]
MSITPLNSPRSIYRLRNTEYDDFPGIIELTKKTYPFTDPYDHEQLASQRQMFPQGQFVVIEKRTGKVVGFSSSLIIDWDDYKDHAEWFDITADGYFTNHDPEHGKTLYGAEVMVDPEKRGQGVGKIIYQAREDLVRRLELLRIRAGARLRDYHRYAHRMSIEDYVKAVVAGKYTDRTLSFQLKRGFNVINVVRNYLVGDPESLGYAAIIEWINHAVALPEDYADLALSPYKTPLKIKVDRVRRQKPQDPLQ